MDNNFMSGSFGPKWYQIGTCLGHSVCYYRVVLSGLHRLVRPLLRFALEVTNHPPELPASRPTHSKTTATNMEYGPIPVEKFDAAIDHLRRSFPDEPLNASVGLSVHGQPCDLLEHYDLHTMQEGMSVMAMDKDTGEIAGVALNGTSRKGDMEKFLEEMKTIDCIPYQRIFGLLIGTNKELDLFSKYEVDKIFDLRILSVDNRYRGRGLAKELFARSEVIAEENGFELMKVDATSLFTQRICQSFGLTVEKTVRYHDFRDEYGRKIYNTESPHDFYKVMVKRLSPRKNIN